MSFFLLMIIMIVTDKPTNYRATTYTHTSDRVSMGLGQYHVKWDTVEEESLVIKIYTLEASPTYFNDHDVYDKGVKIVLCPPECLRHKPINFQRLYRLTFQHSPRSSYSLLFLGG